MRKGGGLTGAVVTALGIAAVLFAYFVSAGRLPAFPVDLPARGAAAVVVAGAVPPAPLPEQPGTATPVTAAGVEVVFRSAGGEHRVRIPEDALAGLLADHRSRLEADHRALRAAAAEHLRRDVGAVFDEIDARVELYVDWVYGWTSSYVLSYQLLLRAGESAYENYGQAADQQGLMMLVERDLNDYVTDRFDALVVLPERSNAQLEEAWRRVLALTAETDAQLRRDRLEHLRFAVDRMALDDGRPAARTLVLDDANPAGALLAGAGVPAEATIRRTMDAGGEPVTVFLRSVRPLVSRATGIVVRGAVAAGAGSMATLGLGGAGGAVAAGATALGVIWGIDYGVNEVDAWLHRDDFTIRMHGVAAHGREQSVAALDAELTRRLDSDLAAVEAALPRTGAGPGAGSAGPAPPAERRAQLPPGPQAQPFLQHFRQRGESPVVDDVHHLRILAERVAQVAARE